MQKMLDLESQRLLGLADVLKMLGVATLYALFKYIEQRYFDGNTIVRPFGVPSGFALAVLLIGGKRYVWSVFIGGVLINATITPLAAAVAISSGDALGALGGAWLLARDQRFDPAIRSLRDYLRLILLGGVTAVSIGAITGVTALLLIGFITPEIFLQKLTYWWTGSVLGVFLVTPLILVIFLTRNDWLDGKRVAEAALLLGLTFIAGQIIFLDWFRDTFNLLQPIAKAYWTFLFIALIAYRLGTPGVVIAMNLMAKQALLGAYQGTGFFADDIAQTQLVSYWCYTAILSAIGMALASHFTERKRVEDELREALDRKQKIANQVPGLVYQFRQRPDGSSCLPFSNDAIRNIFRVSPEDVREDASRLFALVHPDDLAGVASTIQVSVRDLTRWHHEFRVKFDDGTVNWLLADSVPQREPDGSTLWHGFITDITGRKRAEWELLESRSRLQELTSYLQTVREEERTRIARELHDEFGQMLTGIKLDAKWLSSSLSSEQPSIVSKIASMSKLIDETMDGIRRVAADLRPVMLDDLGLVAAVEWLAEEFGKRTGIDIRLEVDAEQPHHGSSGVSCDMGDFNLDGEVAIAIFRIAQECLTNVSRHAQAAHVLLSLQCLEDKIVLRISDDGKGMPTGNERRRNSYGIMGMRERARGLGGTLNFSSVMGKGTSVELVMPIKLVEALGAVQ